MISKEYSQLFNLLYEKTLSGEVNWIALADDKLFIVKLSDYSITIRQFNNVGDSYLKFSILDKKGMELDEFTVIDTDNTWETAYELYSYARRSALKINDAIISIKDILSRSGIIGDIDDETIP